jgi:hypothetical protein
MNVVNALFSIAEHTLSIYKTKDARKYLDEVIALRKAYYNEENKPEELRNHAVMDNAVNRLCIIVEETTNFKEQSATN